MSESKILLTGVLPPVEALTLLLPYPPKAGRAMNTPPMMFATPNATSSRFGLKFRFLKTFPLVASPTPKLFAATLDSKKPRSAMTKLVLKASEAYAKCEGCSGNRAGNGLPMDSMLPRIARPFLSQPNFQVKMAESTTITNRSGTYAADGYRG